MVPKKVCPSCYKKKLYFDYLDLVCQDCYDEQKFRYAIGDWSYFRSKY